MKKGKSYDSGLRSSGRSRGVEKEAINRIRDVIRLDKKAGYQALMETVAEIVDLAEHNLNHGEYAAAAENYDLAAYACRIYPGIRLIPKAIGYARRAKAIRKNARSSSGGLEDAASDYQIVLIIGVFILSLVLFSPNFVGLAVGDSSSLALPNFLGLCFFILGLVLFSIYKNSRRLEPVPNPMYRGKRSVDLLVQEGILTGETARKLKRGWVKNIDELYARVKSCDYADDGKARNLMEEELGIEKGSLDCFKRQLSSYASLELVNAPEPERHPKGYRGKKRFPIGYRANKR